MNWQNKSLSQVEIQTFVVLLLHPFNDLFSRTTWVRWYQKGKTSLDLNEARDDGVLGWQWHQLDHMQTICTSLQADNHTNTSSFNFYRPDALPDAQPTVSKHWRQQYKVYLLKKEVLRETSTLSDVENKPATYLIGGKKDRSGSQSKLEISSHRFTHDVLTGNEVQQIVHQLHKAHAAHVFRQYINS